MQDLKKRADLVDAVGHVHGHLALTGKAGFKDLGDRIELGPHQWLRFWELRGKTRTIVLIMPDGRTFGNYPAPVAMCRYPARTLLIYGVRAIPTKA
ncbi:hypothetical protein A2V94_07175 [Candidatus Atribacteria bacterium RBG_16_35_8]|nr:MAG: hypothetical protein A2V94_07175 [Candidatus Atribacteria bacterium RBG_16_35_8]